MDKPDLKGRVEILKVHSKDVLMDDSVDLNEIALATSGAVGSDLANMINEAAINAVKLGREYVSQKDLFDAVEQVLVGKEKKDRVMSKEERKIVSYHEVGHALLSALQKNSEPVQKITIVPRTMGALGYVMHVPEEEKYLDTEAELRDRLVSLLGGRAAEEIVFDTVTTGAANDIEQATSIARNMITRFGMSKKFGLMGLATVESQYLDGRASLTCSDVTAADIDSEVMKLLHESYKKAKKLLKENREIMDKLAAHLIEKETITGKEFMRIYRKEKGIPEPEEEKEGGTQEQTQPMSQQPGGAGPAVQPQGQSAVQQPGGANPAVQPQRQPVAQRPGGGNSVVQPQSQPMAQQSGTANFQIPPMAGAGQPQSGAQMQGQPQQHGMPNDRQGQQDAAAGEIQSPPSGNRGLFSQAPDPGHSFDENE